VRYCPTDVMWADVLTKPLQGQKFRDMHAFLQNCSRSYDDDIELQTDKLARKSLKPQVKTVASSWECVGECTKSTREKKGQNKSPCCVSWGGGTRAVSHAKTRQGSTPCHAKMSLEGILKQATWPNHIDKRYKKISSSGKKICEEQG
jgi:hypothetical protein